MALVLLLPGLGAAPLFDWDEIIYAEAAREMVLSGDWLTPQHGLEPFAEKPPLVFWMMALSYKLLGVSAFSARLVNVLAGLFTLGLVYAGGRKLGDQRLGVYWGLLWLAGLTTQFYFRTALLDPWFNALTFLALGLTFLAFHPNKKPHNRTREVLLLLAAGVVLGLAVLSKGLPPGLVAGLTALLGGVWTGVSFKRLIWGGMLVGLVAVCVAGSWYGALYLNGQEDFIAANLSYQVGLARTPFAGMKGFPGFHVVVLLVGCLPFSLLGFSGFFQKFNCDSPAQLKAFHRWMVVLTLVVLVVYELVSTKYVPYAALAWFPLSFLAAHGVWRSTQSQFSTRWPVRLHLGGLALLTALLLLPLLFVILKSGLLRHIPDLTFQEQWAAPVEHPEILALPGLLLLGVVLWTARQVRRQPLQDRVLVVGWLGSALAVSLSASLLIPLIHARTQGPVVHWLEQDQQARIYVQHKSFAPAWFTRQEQPDPAHQQNPEAPWRVVLNPEQAEPTFVIVHAYRAEAFAQEHPNFHLADRAPGYRLFARNGLIDSQKAD